jgi:hypothetical protein
MIPAPPNVERHAGERGFLAVGSPWLDATLALMEKKCPYTPWYYVDGMRAGDLLVTVLSTNPRVFACVERMGTNTDGDLTVAERWDARTMPKVPRGLGLPRLPAVLDDETTDAVLRLLYGSLSSFGWHALGVETPTTAEAARIIMDSGGECTHCAQSFDLTTEDAREHIHVRQTPAKSVVGKSYRGWPAALCDDCDRAMMESGYDNYLDFRLSPNPPCPACGAHRTAVYRPLGYISIPTRDMPWEINWTQYDGWGSWLCHDCHHVFGPPPSI